MKKVVWGLAPMPSPGHHPGPPGELAAPLRPQLQLFLALPKNQCAHTFSVLPPACAPVYGWSVWRSPTVSLHCHFLALSLVCVHTTQLHLKICIFYMLPNEQLHQLNHGAIGNSVHQVINPLPPSKTPPPLPCQALLKSANCPSPPFQVISPFYNGFS